jgi:hypothetical protein
MQTMQQTLLKGRFEAATGPSFAWPDAEYSLDVAIVYQDAPARQWAGRVQARLAELVGEEAIRCTEWNINDLSERGTFSAGVAALARADVIVVSVYEGQRLPPAFYLWVNLWLEVRSGRPGALVALVVPAEGSDCGARETRRYLCAVAGQGRLKWLESDQPGDPISGYREELFQWPKAA